MWDAVPKAARPPEGTHDHPWAISRTHHHTLNFTTARSADRNADTQQQRQQHQPQPQPPSSRCRRRRLLQVQVRVPVQILSRLPLPCLARPGNSQNPTTTLQTAPSCTAMAPSAPITQARSRPTPAAGPSTASRVGLLIAPGHLMPCWWGTEPSRSCWMRTPSTLPSSTPTVGMQCAAGRPLKLLRCRSR